MLLKIYIFAFANGVCPSQTHIFRSAEYFAIKGWGKGSKRSEEYILGIL